MSRVNHEFWAGKKVFLTGHTGFKGSWLAIWLNLMGAKVSGYSLSVPTEPSLFKIANIESFLQSSVLSNVTDLVSLQNAINQVKPDIVIHMAAQPLVRSSYQDPIATYQTNIMGTVNIMEAARNCGSASVILNVTTDKCYDNKEWHWGYRESDPLGGYDPYSSSKACSELITNAYRSSFFDELGIKVATARAGNVIGGGDWAEDRLIPDIVRSLTSGTEIQIRNPNSVRPWQHVLEPLSGYLVLCENLYNGDTYDQAWNFGPPDNDVKAVKLIVEKMLDLWTYNHPGYSISMQAQHHEASLLKLDSSKARNELSWKSKWSLEKALSATMEWVLAVHEGVEAHLVCKRQIAEYESN
ncbi:CDP-glucose 4,6-dehydratase [Paenibacillus herberti]|uniref:CDP-glucose 4,6-dehydratase n=1 Tax=Paenibacillus herberti TaxID=1619309 RepID=A0A229NWL0_9BACL|nr:CDP-glucose 4,6-dehydratase [Paenibacillus herberti]OXM14115.1 CDP-glucose 4,6-dehydratase [Paenibacillus herberti]